MKKQTTEGKDIRFAVREQVPHKDKMLLIDGTAYKDGDTVKLSFAVPADNVFVAADAVLAPVALVEMLAQLCGAQHTFDHGLRADELHGYLVGIDNVAFSGPVHAGDELTFTAWKTFDMQDIKRVKGEVHKGSERIAVIELTLFESGDWIPKPQLVGQPHGMAGAASFATTGLFREKDAVGKGILASIASMAAKPDGDVEAELVFPREFAGFSGHFPGYPVLAAVLAIYSGWLLAELSQQQELELCSIRRAKFAAPILPNEKIEVSLKKTGRENGDEDWYSLTLKSLGQLAAKFMIGTKPAARRAKP
jgi:3-hydroxyacyl-[acyl-carrier-protein] dehydratase